MPSSRRVRLTSEARDDLRELLQYSLQRWGATQRDEYKVLIRRSLRDLAEFPGIGRSRDDLAPGLRSHPVGQHIVFYRVTGNTLLVRRIIHHSRAIDAEIDS